MTLKLRALDNGKEKLVDVTAVGGANVVILNVPCELSVYVKSAVRMKSNGEATNALADSEANANVLGIVVNKPTTTTCDIRVLGVTAEIFTALDVTKEYYLSDTVAGELTTTIPVDSGHVVLRLGQPFSTTEFMVNKGTGLVRA
jgi:hypothetical protein